MPRLIKELVPDCTIDDVKKILIDTSADCGEVGYDIYYGNGLIKVDAILNYLDVYIPEVKVSDGICDNVKWIYIHNNSGKEFKANGYLVKYEDNRLADIEMVQNIDVNDGVTGCSYEGEFDCFMLWSEELMPYTGKYMFE